MTVFIDFFKPNSYCQQKAYAALLWRKMPYLGDEEPGLVLESDDLEELVDAALQRKKAVLVEFWSRDDRFEPEQWERVSRKKWTCCKPLSLVVMELLQ